MIRKWLRTLATLLEVQYAYMVEYRAELLLWTLSGILPFILMGAWMKASQNTQLGLSSLDLARYFLATFIARQFSIVWVIWEFEKQIVQGTLSPRLLQPIDPGWHHLTSHLSERLARLPFAIVLVAIFFALYPQSFWIPSLSGTLLFILAVTLAFGLRFIMQYTFAMFAFWIERAAAIEQFWFLFYLFLSGLIAPLELFPPLVRQIVFWTPFPYMIHFPAALLVGIPVDVGRSLLVIGLWSGVFLVLNRWLWRKGLKQYSGMGA